MAFGVSFLPGGDQANGQNKPPAEPLQQAIQMLSLRLPRVVGAQGIAPGPLLNSPGGSGGGLAELLARLFGQGRPGGSGTGMPGGPMPGGPAPTFPPPNVTPGKDEPGRIYDPLNAPPGGYTPQPIWQKSPMRDKYDFNQQGNTGPAGF